jgi:hypothetical protein
LAATSWLLLTENEPVSPVQLLLTPVVKQSSTLQRPTLYSN